MRRDDHLVAPTNPRGSQHDRQRRCPRRHAHAMATAAVLGEVRFEALNLLTKDEGARAEDAIEDAVKLCR